MTTLPPPDALGALHGLTSFVDEVNNVAEVTHADEVAALITAAAGADSAAIDALEAVTAALRRTQVARTRLATRVPSEVLRHALLRQGGPCHDSGGRSESGDARRVAARLASS